MCWVLKREFVGAFILACKSDLKSNPGSHTQGTLVRRGGRCSPQARSTQTRHTRTRTPRSTTLTPCAHHLLLAGGSGRTKCPRRRCRANAARATCQAGNPSAPMLATIYQRLSESTEFPWRALLLGVIVVGGLMIGVGGETEDGWYTLYWYGAVLILTAQMSHTTRSFFMGEGTAPWFSVPSWQRHRSLPWTVYPVPAARGARLWVSVCQRPFRSHRPGPSIWNFLRYFLALDGDLKTVEKAPTRPPARHTLSPHTLTLNPLHPAQPSPTLTPYSHRCQGVQVGLDRAQARRLPHAHAQHLHHVDLRKEHQQLRNAWRPLRPLGRRRVRRSKLQGPHQEERACHVIPPHRGPSSSASS